MEVSILDKSSQPLFLGLVWILSVAVSNASPSTAPSDTSDPHGGVPMGVVNDFCDNGKNFTYLDWDPKDTDVYTCHKHERRPKAVELRHYSHCDTDAKRPIHVCFPQIITYTEDIPTSGRHRPLWPKYGEYKYLPRQRWLHSLEHGSVVFLYHPCANPVQVSKFKNLAKNCLRRHIISPYKKLPEGMNFALLTWRCKLLLSRPSLPMIVDFIKKHALHAPERSVYTEGQYDIELLHHAKVVSDMEESELCPNLNLLQPAFDEMIKASEKRRLQHEIARKRLLNILNPYPRIHQ